MLAKGDGGTSESKGEASEEHKVSFREEKTGLDVLIKGNRDKAEEINQWKGSLGIKKHFQARRFIRMWGRGRVEVPLPGT